MTDEELDALLGADAAAGPADDGFTQRLLQRLPPWRPAVAVSRLPRRAAQLAALSAALFGFGLLWPADAAALAQAGEQSLAALVLLGLSVWWSLPQSGNNAWR